MMATEFCVQDFNKSCKWSGDQEACQSGFCVDTRVNKVIFAKYIASLMCLKCVTCTSLPSAGSGEQVVMHAQLPRTSTARAVV